MSSIQIIENSRACHGMDWNGLLDGFCVPIPLAMGEKTKEIDCPNLSHQCV